METVHHIILHYGYAGIFSLLMLGIVGLPVPDETLLAFCGFLANKGELHIVWTILAAFLGSCSGISVSYLLGRGPGFALVKRYGKYIHFEEDKIDRVHQWFRKIGKWILVIGYFIPGVRHFSAMVAGSSRLTYLEFAPYAYAGALIWSTAFICAGYFFGKEWEKMSGSARDLFLLVAGGAVILGLAWWLIRRIVQRSKERQKTG
jgi:membrane protein DedA with SNARE-associated domain